MILTKDNIKSIDLDNRIYQYVSSGRFPEFIIIVPTNRKSRNLKKSFIDNAPNQVSSGINIETLTTISTTLLKRSESFVELSEAASSVFIKKSAEKISFKYFNNYRDGLPEGTLDRLKNVISKYKEAGITPDRLRKEAGRLSGSEQFKAIDIAGIYQRYDEMCNKANAYELGDIYRQLNNLEISDFCKNFRDEYPSVKDIFINGFDEFTGPEIEIIDKLSNIQGVSLYLDFDYYSYNRFIFSNLDKNYEKFIHKNFQKVVDESEYLNTKFIERIRKNLFKSGDSGSPAKLQSQLNLITASNREEEVEKIAKQIKVLLKNDNKIEPHRICVCFNLIDNYSPLIRDVFERYAVPFNLTDRINLNRTYPINTIISFLEISESNYFYKNIIKTFSSNYLDSKGIDTTNLLHQAKKNKVVSGYDKWINSLELSLKKLEFETDDRIRLEQKKVKILKALDDLKLIKTLLIPFEAKNSIDDFIKNLMDLINKLQFHKYLINSNPISSEKNVKALTTFIDTITETFDLLKKFENSGEKYSLSYYLKYIRTACGRARFNIKERSDYGVLITTLNEIRGLKFDYVFLGGMIDGDLPTRYSPEIFLSGSYSLSESIHQTEERFRFYQALCTWCKGLYLSYPMGDNRSEFAESSFLNEIGNLYELSQTDDQDFSNIIISKDEFLKNINFKDDISKLKEISNHEWKIDFEEINSRIRIEEDRTADIFAESPYNSFLLSENSTGEQNNQDIRDKIRIQLEEFRNKAFSITELETYVKCPFKYFLERILKIEVTEDPSEEFEALEIGSVLHSILFQFYKTIRAKNIVLQNCSEKMFNESLDDIFSIAGRVIAELNLDSDVTFFEMEKIFGIEGRKEQSILYKFVEYERNSDDKFIPEFFEVNFGNKNRRDSDDRLQFEQPIEIENVRLKGKIDRIELNRNNNEYSITDYKIGRTFPTKAEMDSGISLQLPVYLMAAKTLLKYNLDEEFLPMYMNIFSLRMNVNDFGKAKIYAARKSDDQPEINKELISNTIDIIKTQVNKICNGEFHLSKWENREKVVCRFCNFKSVCRVEEYLS